MRAFPAVLLLLLAATPTSPLIAQRIATPLPTWRAAIEDADTGRAPLVGVAAGNHTTKGLLIGAAVGAAAATVFLIGFCSDSDTACQADEVARAALIIGVPFAAAGAIIGALSRSD